MNYRENYASANTIYLNHNIGPVLCACRGCIDMHAIFAAEQIVRAAATGDVS